MHHRIDVEVTENVVEQLLVAHVTFDELDPGVGQLLKTGDRFATAVAQVIEQQHLLAGVDEGQGSVGTDEAGPACDQRGFSEHDVIPVREPVQRVVKTDLNSCGQRGCSRL